MENETLSRWLDLIIHLLLMGLNPARVQQKRPCRSRAFLGGIYLLDSDGFGEVSRLVDVTGAADCDAVGAEGL